MSVQLSFADELFAVADNDGVTARWWQWLRTRYRRADGTRVGITEAARPVFDRLLARFGTSEAFERSKCLEVMDGFKRREGWSIDDADALGLFDGGISYQVCWARAAAANVGASPEVAARVESQTDYCWGRWAFEDGSGKVVWRQGGTE